MEVFRISHASFADLSGNGGLFNKGRWHSKGRAIVYTAGTRSLSMLERYIHEDGQSVLPNLVMMTIYIPDEAPFDTLSIHDLPTDWFSHEDVSQDRTRKLGDDWLLHNTTPVLKVPSAIVPQEYNYLVNPVAAKFNKIKIIDVREYNYEFRYKSLISNSLS